MAEPEPAFEPVGSPQPATRIWCIICRRPSKFRAIPVEPVSTRNLEGFVGNHLKCSGCGSVMATVYAEADGYEA